MIKPAQLEICLTSGTLRPKLGACTLNVLRGGPETLLRWLETQLGLPAVENHRASCIAEYASALDSITDSLISKSMANDRWATASELLWRRDELLTAGWNQSDVQGLPDVVRDMAQAENGRRFAFSSMAERISRVLSALDDGQLLPAHVCILAEGADQWPKRWQAVLCRLNLETIPEVPLAAADGTALRSAQSVVRRATGSVVQPDRSLRYIPALSQTAAVEFVAATLAHTRDQTERTVILCEDDHLAMQLDACLLRYGLPTMGASAYSTAHPALQVLPLSLALCWQPVDPRYLLDFLTLPVRPVPRQAADKLAAALTEQPGLDSSAWQASLEKLCSSENDPDGTLRQQLDEWLYCRRVAKHTLIPAQLVRDRCSSVAQWATRQAAFMEGRESSQSLKQALLVAAGQAKLLAELAHSSGSELSEPQLSRLIEEALSAGVETVAAIEATGGPIRVRSLAEITDPCYRLIWLGLGTADAPACRWSADQLQALRSQGIDVDDGTKSLTSLRAAEARGFSLIEDSLLAIRLPQDLEKRCHPVWLTIRSVFAPRTLETTPVLESLIERDRVSLLEPFTCPVESVVVERQQPPRPVWTVDPILFSDRRSVSATDLEDRLACPLKWVFRYQANLRPGPIAQLPNDYRLKGNFCHRILEHAFRDGGELPPVDTAVARVEQLFDERIELDAAPLAQSDKYRERQALRRQLAHATRVLISTLASGGYRIKGIEVEVQGEAFAKPLSGSVDCLIEDAGGNEGIIDFKYGGKKYERMIAEGAAVQLATYAYSRSITTGRFPAVAYLIIGDGLLITPATDPIRGDGNRSLVNGLEIRNVWENFRAAISRAEDWFTTNGQIPARPLQQPQNWPAGVDIVLDSSPEPSEGQPVCKYCDYQHLCGRRQLT